MSAQVLSGSSDATYTNNTGENVRVIINYMQSSSTGLSISGLESLQAIPTLERLLLVDNLLVNIKTLQLPQVFQLN